MAEVLEFFTEHADINGLLDFLAERVDDDGIMLTAAHSIPTGEWVRFSVRMVDGEVGFEGVGKCTGSAENESGVGFEVLLEQLQFDARNEVMFERIQLAKETAETGEGTKPIDISNIAAERQRELARERARERAREQASKARVSAPPAPPPIAKAPSPKSSAPSTPVVPTSSAPSTPAVPTPSAPPAPKIPRPSAPPKLAVGAEKLPKPATQIARMPIEAPIDATAEVDLAQVEDVTAYDRPDAEIPATSVRPPLPSQRTSDASPPIVSAPTEPSQSATIAGGASAPVEAPPQAAPAAIPAPRNKIPYDVRQRLEKIVPTLRRRSIAFDEDEALALALRLGLATLEEMYSKR